MQTERHTSQHTLKPQQLVKNLTMHYSIPQSEYLTQAYTQIEWVRLLWAFGSNYRYATHNDGDTF